MPSYQPPVNGSKISNAYAEAMASAPITRVMLATYEFRHPNFLDVDGVTNIAIRTVNDFTDITATIEAGAPMDAGVAVVFTALPVTVTGPEEGDTGTVPSISLSIDGVSGKIAQQLDLALLSSTPVSVTERLYASDDLSGPARLPVVTMILRSVVVNDVTVTAQATFYDLSNNAFPRKEYTLAEYPALSS